MYKMKDQEKVMDFFQSLNPQMMGQFFGEDLAGEVHNTLIGCDYRNIFYTAEGEAPILPVLVRKVQCQHWSSLQMTIISSSLKLN